MNKQIATYFLFFLIVVSIIIPTYVSLTEGTCKIIEVVDLGGGEEKNGKESAKDIELNIYCSESDSSLLIDLEKKKRIRSYSKKYVSYQKKIFSPPPEILT